MSPYIVGGGLTIRLAPSYTLGRRYIFGCNFFYKSPKFLALKNFMMEA